MRTPLAGGNIALFADRWKLIEHDTLPCYLAFIRDNPEPARELITEKVTERVRRYLLPAQAGRLAGTVLTGWGLDTAARPSPRSSVSQPRRFDLTCRPTRESEGFAEGAGSEGAGSKGAGSKICVAPRGRPFEVEVLLPEEHTYHAWAELAVMLSGHGDEPGRLTVQLPPMGIDTCRTQLDTLSADWGFPADAAAAWYDGAKRREAGDRHYLTHVFTCSDVGPVHLEFQVAHHVRDREAVVTALFSGNFGESA